MPEDKLTLEMLEIKQKEMTKTAMEMLGEKDGTKIFEMSKNLRKMGEELEQMAKAFETEALAEAATPAAGFVTVQLTPEQTERIQEETGVEMKVVDIESDGPFMSTYMPHAIPAMIESIALEQAKKKVQLAKSREDNINMAQETIQVLKNQKNPDLQKQLKKLQEDPNFLGGLLNPED